MRLISTCQMTAAELCKGCRSSILLRRLSDSSDDDLSFGWNKEF